MPIPKSKTIKEEAIEMARTATAIVCENLMLFAKPRKKNKPLKELEPSFAELLKIQEDNESLKSDAFWSKFCKV